MDSFSFQNVGLIKIDVEGHESAILEGARVTINTSRPILLIEIESRHTRVNMNDTFEKIKGYSYSGYFLWKGALQSVDNFDVGLHQKLLETNPQNHSYVNNFIWVPR